jgi:xyloglucan-specific exo-beta-1,4-glucanase
MARLTLVTLLAGAVSFVAGQAFTWKNVYTGAGGGWIGNVVFNPSKKGLGAANTASYSLLARNLI